MKKTKCFTTIIMLSFLLLFSLTACQGPQGPRGDPTQIPVEIWGDVWINTFYEADGAWICVTRPPSIPQVSINDFVCDQLLFMQEQEIEFSASDLSVSPGDSVYVTIEYPLQGGSNGCAYTDLVMPALFTITSHDTSATQILTYGSGLTFDWTSSDFADAYLLDFEMSFNYLDSLGDFKAYRIRIDDSLIVDTTLSIDSEYLFPDSVIVESFLFGSAFFNIWAQYGYWTEIGAGNVFGDGSGQITAHTYGGKVNFDVVE